jgi:hypothetical protein
LFVASESPLSDEPACYFRHGIVMGGLFDNRGGRPCAARVHRC